MDIKQVMKIAQNKRGGVWSKVEYEKECKVLADFVKQGYSVIKHNTITGQFKCKYESKSDNPRESYYEAVIPKMVYTLKKDPSKFYVAIRPNFVDFTKPATYKVFHNGVDVTDKVDYKTIVCGSELKHHDCGDNDPYLTFKVESIISIS